MIGLTSWDLREYFGRLPTTDLYFMNPLTELRRQWPNIPPARHLASNVYLVGKTGVIVRYGRATDLERLRRAGATRVVYIVDDDFAAGGSDQSLPESYRMKLRAFAEGDWRTLRTAADVVVVPGSVLAETYGAKSLIVPPAWNRRPASTEHFATPKHLEIVHLGTGSHRGDLAVLVAPLSRILDAHPNARLTLFAGATVPGELRSHRHLKLRRPLSWWRYKRALPKMRFHLAIYPLAPTPFNRARSANKLYEHAVVGAASLMSPNPALRAAAGSGAAATFVEGDADAWEAKILELISAPGALQNQVERARIHLAATDPLGYSALQWRDILAPEL